MPRDGASTSERSATQGREPNLAHDTVDYAAPATAVVPCLRKGAGHFADCSVGRESGTLGETGVGSSTGSCGTDSVGSGTGSSVRDGSAVEAWVGSSSGSRVGVIGSGAGVNVLALLVGLGVKVGAALGVGVWLGSGVNVAVGRGVAVKVAVGCCTAWVVGVGQAPTGVAVSVWLTPGATVGKY